MRCESCGFANPEGKKFCEECGTKLVRVCPSCGAEVRPAAKFCGDCGTLLTGQPASPQASAASLQPLAPPRADGERRQLTVQFIDLVGSTTLSQQLDPEDYHARVVAYQTACHRVIARYEGHIAQYLGDGVLVYFGYPGAHEDDAGRAVRSSLEIVAAVGDLKFTPSLQVRIGIHTGPVVVSEIGAGERTERLALGETPNIAARVQGHAAPNEVLVSPTTFRLMHGLFETEGRGPQELKGISTPMTLYRVVRESTVQSRFEAAVQTGLTPLVGREEELTLLRRRWEQAKEREGQVVLLSGEAGMGKSRLVQEMKDRVSVEGVTRIEFRCSPYHQNSTFFPIIDHLQRLLKFTREDSPATKLEKLQHTLSHYRFPRADTLPLLAALLSLPHPEGAPPITVSPQKQKEKTQAALVAWLVEEADQVAVYCAWEDLHWADPSTLEVLTLFLNQLPTTRVLTVLTYRPEFTPSWGSHSYLSQLTLSRLGQTQVEAMVEKVTGGKTLPKEVVRQIASKTDGVPLFVEELTKMVMESDLVTEVNGHYELSGLLPPLAIPSTLQDSLMARLDRLATVREIAQVGATLGREFTYELLQAVSSLNEEALQHGLRQLVEAELVYQSGIPPQARYLFKHALIQDTAYQSLLKSRRQQLHQQIAQVLAGRFSETVETQPELLAHHYTEAGLKEQAIPYWQKAGQRASQRSANVEAISHLTKGLELLNNLPDTRDRTHQELTLRITLGTPLQAIRGFSSPEVRAVYARARELCHQVGETRQLFPILFGLRTFHHVGGEFLVARELGEQLLGLAQREHDPALLVEAYRALGSTLFHLGEFGAARTHLEQGLTLYDAQRHHPHVFLYSTEPGVFGLSYVALVLWHLGYPDQALQKSIAACTLAQDLSHPFSLAAAEVYAALLHQLRREVPRTQEWAEAGITLAREQGFPDWLGQGAGLQGWALAEQGQSEEGITQICQGRASYRGGKIFQSYFFVLLAEAYGKAGQAEEGLAVLAEALTMVDKSGERFYEAEWYRLRGELLLAQESSEQGARSQGQRAGSRAQEIEICFLKAIDVARTQQAKSLELRAVMSLSRLWKEQGKKAEARQLLSEIYHWFTEGFDTKDLQEAKALLEELN